MALLSPLGLVFSITATLMGNFTGAYGPVEAAILVVGILLAALGGLQRRLRKRTRLAEWPMLSAKRP